MNPHTKKSKLILLLAVAACMALSACGRRGPLEPHPDAPPEQRTRPAADNSDTSAQAGRPAIGGSRRTLSSPIPPPQRPFILDKIL